ncbi:MAG: flagellar biosynthesis protein FlhB [Verrucomicrobia bacterium]|nr:flagellar biosynthesis protein FlhB [Verrucomicrobiota bacterium]
MAEEDKEARTETATPKRRNEAREKGSVAQSADVSSVVVLFLGLLCLWFGGSFISRQFKDLLRVTFETYTSVELTPSSTYPLLLQILGRVALMMAPVLLVVVVASVVASVIQYGWLWSPQALKPKLDQLKPKLSRLNMLSKDKLVDLAVAVGKIALIGLVAYWSIKGYLLRFVPLMDQTVPQIADFTVGVALRVSLKIIIVLIVLATLDYVWKRHRHEEKLKMTKQQVKDERKNVEGDPQVKGHIRGLQLKASMRRMMHEVPKADVVITNPTHYAIALQYDAEVMPAPKVIAKGARLLAERIIALAKAHHVPIVQNPPLAQALYKSAEVGGFVPIAFYHAVAEVLAYVYALGQARVLGRVRPQRPASAPA